jgi:hypothetical protein
MRVPLSHVHWQVANMYKGHSIPRCSKWHVRNSTFIHATYRRAVMADLHRSAWYVCPFQVYACCALLPIPIMKHRTQLKTDKWTGQIFELWCMTECAHCGMWLARLSMIEAMYVCTFFQACHFKVRSVDHTTARSILECFLIS